MNLKQRILGILFVSGDEGVDSTAMAETLEISEEHIHQTLAAISHQLEKSDVSPVQLVRYDQTYYLVTKPDLAKDIERYAQNPFAQKLSRSAVETLAIIAYRQPVTRITIDEIRGVSSQNMVQKLIHRGLIRSAGHLEAPGRPHLYEVTPYFMDYFGLRSLEDLPQPQPLNLHPESLATTLFDQRKLQLYDEVDSAIAGEAETSVGFPRGSTSDFLETERPRGHSEDPKQ